MRTYFLFAAVALVLHAPQSTPQSGGFTLTLTVNGQPCGNAALYKAHDKYDSPMDELLVAELPPLVEGRAVSEIPACEPGLYALMYCGRNVNPLMYAAPGDRIAVRVSVNALELPTAIFSGDNALVNNFMAEYQTEIRRRAKKEAGEPEHRRFEAFEAASIKRHWEWVKFYDTYFEGVVVPERFRHAVCTNIKCRRATETIDYLMKNYYLPVNAGGLSQIPYNDGFMDFQNDMPKPDTLAVQYPCYRDLLQRYAALLGHKLRAEKLRVRATDVGDAAQCTWDALRALNDPLMRDAAMYSTILLKMRLPDKQHQECARQMLEQFRTEARDYRYYAAAKRVAEGD